MHTVEQHIVAEAKELCASQRWQSPGTPGSAQIEELGARLASPETYAAFRNTAEGEYLLPLIEAYEAALNDDWLPANLAGLPLDKAREFIHAVATALENNPLPIAVRELRVYYSQLAQP
ncbi:MAG: hypothetical protein JWN73_4419 [Betaproteobacteria bacterium]|nr:hypothetical protein [Betaproteobacteria bacterium]